MTPTLRSTILTLASLLAMSTSSCTGSGKPAASDGSDTQAAAPAVATALPRPTAPAAKGPLRVLFVGNSHTDYYVSLPKLFSDLCAHNKVDVQVDELVEMGISLDEIYEGSKEKADALFAKTDADGNYYDYVVLQEKTPVAIAEPATYLASARMFAEKVRQHSPGSAIYIYELMSPLNFKTEHSEFEELHAEISRNAVDVAKAIPNAGVYRVGDAVRDAYQGSDGYRYEANGTDRLRHGEVNLHMLNDAGFMASALLYMTLFDKQPAIPDAMTFATGTGDGDTQKEMAVKEAVSNPAALLQIAAHNK